MEKIKVLRIITRMNIGGPAIQAALLSAGLDRDRFLTLLVTGPTGKNEGDMSYLAHERGIEPLVISELERNLNIIKDVISFYKLYNFIKKEKPDIVHTHTAKAGTLGRLAARLAGVPVVIHTFHGHIFHSYFSPFKSRFFLLVEKALVGITDKIVVISEKQSDEIRRYLNLNCGSKLTLIPLGFNLEKFLKCDKDDKGDKLREELGMPKEAVVIGTVGRLTAVKNHRMFLKGAEEIKRKNPDKVIKFLIVGDGELKNSLMTLANTMGLYKDVIFTGWRKDMDSVYKAIDIVTLTSLNEGTPVSLIEGSANGKATVATDVGGVRNVVEDGRSGYVIPLDDINIFSDAVSSLVNDREKRERFGQYGRDLIKERFTEDKLINAVEDLYCRELRRKRRVR